MPDERTPAELAAAVHEVWEGTFDPCPIQVVFGPDQIEDCTFRRGHQPPHSWAVPGVYEIPGEASHA